METRGLTVSPISTVIAHGGNNGGITTLCTAHFPCRHTHTAAECTRPNKETSPHTKKIHKREDKTCTSGSEMRVDEINPARMRRGGEHPCEAGTAHGENYKKNQLYLHKLTFGAVFLAPHETQSL